MIRETYNGRQLKAIKGKSYGKTRIFVNGTDLGEWLGTQAEQIEWAKRTIDDVDSRPFEGRWTECWYEPGTYELNEHGHVVAPGGTCSCSYCISRREPTKTETPKKAFAKCWVCNQPATHVFTRAGSNTLHACDSCTRIDRAEAESRGWIITKKGTEMTKNETVATFNIEGRDYEVIRIGRDPKTRSWNVFGVFPKYTAAELALPDPKRPYLHIVYAAPAEDGNGWMVHDEMNRVELGPAANYEDMARISAKDPHRPLV
ncbi:hypothetical protein [Streptomyces bullii]|uniref:Uncharacterized protein n=1 Tax=Streptomyces bullii TaxID=349910 RepID=A0ABW0UNL6_9ACTN